MDANFTHVDFKDVQVGDRLRFWTRDTGFNGRGHWLREGVVTRKTAKTVVVECDAACGTAVIRIADWQAREPRKPAETTDPEGTSRS